MNLQSLRRATWLGGLTVFLAVFHFNNTGSLAEAQGSASDQPTLESQLKERREGFAKRVPAEIRKVMKEKAEELAQSGIGEKSLGLGDKVPDFELPNASGGKVRLSSLLKEGPVVVSFYRGGWCPYCNLELRALQRVLPEIERQGGRLVVISPELPDKSLSTQEKNELKFDVLSDKGNKVAKKFGLVFSLAAEIRPIYKQFGIDLAAQNGDSSFELPVPATYVINRDATVSFAFVNTDYTHRAEPADVVKALTRSSK